MRTGTSHFVSLKDAQRSGGGVLNHYTPAALALTWLTAIGTCILMVWTFSHFLRIIGL